jgi:hypothetical protein
MKAKVNIKVMTMGWAMLAGLAALLGYTPTFDDVLFGTGAGLLAAAAAAPLGNEAAWTMMKTFFSSHVTALHGLIDKLPESMKGEMKALHDSLNAQLAKLPPIEQVAGAQQAGWALECLSGAMERVQTYATAIMDRLSQLSKEYAGSTTELNGIKEQLKAGELLTKAQSTELCQVAEGRGREAMKPDIIATRKSAIELAGLPVPSDDILGLPAADYIPRVEAARGQFTKLGERGLKIGGKGDGWVKQLTWLPSTEFNGQLKTLDEILPPSGGSGSGSRIDPLLGNQGGGANTEKKGTRLTLA